MAVSHAEYLGWSWGVPLVAFVPIWLLLSSIPNRVNWLVLRSVLGIAVADGPEEKLKKEAKQEAIVKRILQRLGEKSKESTSQPSTEANELDRINNYFYIEFEDEDKESSKQLTYLERLASDFLASAILAIFVSIIFNALILTSQTVKNGEKCPKFDAECYGYSLSQVFGPFNCPEGSKANFNVTLDTWWCAAWVYPETGAKEVIDTLGVCGGLLGIVSLIVPIVYYLSFYKRCVCPIVVTWILPVIPIVVIGVTVHLTRPVGPSALAIIVLSVVSTLVFVGWSWAVRRSCNCSEQRCLEWCCEYSCWTKCFNCCHKRSCTDLSERYPFCCCHSISPENHICYKCCLNHCCCSETRLKIWCENEYEKVNKPQEPATKPKLSLPEGELATKTVQPALLSQYLRSPASSSGKISRPSRPSARPV